VKLTLAEQILESRKHSLMRVEIYNPPVQEEEETVIQEEDTDPTPE